MAEFLEALLSAQLELSLHLGQARELLPLPLDATREFLNTDLGMPQTSPERATAIWVLLIARTMNYLNCCGWSEHAVSLAAGMSLSTVQIDVLLRWKAAVSRFVESASSSYDMEKIKNWPAREDVGIRWSSRCTSTRAHRRKGDPGMAGKSPHWYPQSHGFCRRGTSRGCLGPQTHSETALRVAEQPAARQGNGIRHRMVQTGRGRPRFGLVCRHRRESRGARPARKSHPQWSHESSEAKNPARRVGHRVATIHREPRADEFLPSALTGRRGLSPTDWQAGDAGVGGRRGTGTRFTWPPPSTSSGWRKSGEASSPTPSVSQGVWCRAAMPMHWSTLLSLPSPRGG